MRHFKWTKLIASLFLMALLFASNGRFALAQGVASISGSVEKARTGGGIPGATVTVTNEETGVSRSVTTDEAGKYRVPSLPPGRYTVKGDKESYQFEVQTGIRLVAGQQEVVALHMGFPQRAELREPHFVTAAQATFLTNDDQVVGVDANGVAKAYLTTLMAGHHIIEDHLGDIPILASW